jgi:hypothetical protein
MRRWSNRRQARRTNEWSEAPRSARAMHHVRLGSLVVLLVVGLLAWPGDPGAHLVSNAPDTLQSPWLLLPLAVVAFVALLWTIRLSVFRTHVQAPGPIRLVSFEDATAAPPPRAGEPEANGAQEFAGNGVPHLPAAGGDPVTHASVTHLAMHLRDRLSDLRLHLPTAIPGAQRSSDFVELLGTTKVDVKQPFAALGSLLRLVQPTHAYELKTTLVRRDGPLGHGAAIELTRLPHGHTVFRTYWDDSWAHAIDRAASGVGAHVVPHSRHAETGPWCAWRGKDLSDELFHAYQRAQRRWNQRRYDEALAEYYAALRLDPINEHLRYELGKAQESRALFLDAMLTYHGSMESLKERPSADLDAAAQRARLRMRVLTQYRFTVLLGFGERLARQWLPAPVNAPPTRRSEELNQLRERLVPVFRERYLNEDGRVIADAGDLALLGLDGDDPTKRLDELLADTLEGPKASLSRKRRGRIATPSKQEIERAKQLRRHERTQARAIRKAELRLLFLLFAKAEVARMLDAFDHVDKEQLEELAAELSTTAFQLIKPWVELRTDHARILLRHERGEEVEQAEWPPSPEGIQRLWEDVTPDGRSLKDRLQESRFFTDHYNAAAMYAVGLAHEPGLRVSPDATEPLRRCALTELRRAFDFAPSETLADRWEWIASKDPDLAGLRGDPEFRRFESERLPSARPAPRRPADIEDFQASRDNKWLIRRYARVFERIWHERADLKGPTDVHDAMRWWKEETLAWERARELVLHHRHWQTRVAVVRWLRTVAEKNCVDPVRFVQLSYAENPLDVHDDEVDREAARVVQATNLRLAALHRVLNLEDPDAVRPHESRRPPPLPGLREWRQHFAALDDAGENLNEPTRRKLAVQRASAWSALHQFLDSEDERAARAALVAGIHGLAPVLEAPEEQLLLEPTTAG